MVCTRRDYYHFDDRLNEAALVNELAENGSAYWVGKRADNADEFFEVIVVDLLVSVRRGKIGQRGTTETESYRSRNAALFAAARELVTAATLLGFGPVG